MEKLVIDRAEWLTGAALLAHARAGAGGGTLCNYKSKQKCCLGFYGRKLEISERALEDKSLLTFMRGDWAGNWAVPSWLDKSLDAKDAKRFQRVTLLNRPRVENALSAINDSRKWHPSRREAAITYLFAKYGGVEVTFTGTYTDGTRRAKEALKQ